MTVLLAGFALFEINNLSNQIRHSEQEKVKLWANAISQKAELVNYSEDFFSSVALDEHRKMEMYTNILRSFDRSDMGADADFSLDYVRYIVDSCETAIIITNKDSIITVPSELAGKKLEGDLLREFSHNEPFHYRIWGMSMTLYYKESKMYTELREVLDRFNQSFLSEITNNSVFVPVLVVDSLQGLVLGSGNIPPNEFGTPDRLAEKLCEMEEENDPVEFRLPNGERVAIELSADNTLRYDGCHCFTCLCYACCCWCRTYCSAPPTAWSRTVYGWVWPRRPPTNWAPLSHRSWPGPNISKERHSTKITLLRLTKTSNGWKQ